jgi:hypothetical protein
MTILPVKHKFDNIGKGGAVLMMTVLASIPGVNFLTTGIFGQFTFEALKILNIYLADKGIILANVGVSNIDAMVDKGKFDAAFDDAFKEILAQQEPLTPEQIKAIDDKVIAAFDNFTNLGVRHSGNS